MTIAVLALLAATLCWPARPRAADRIRRRGLTERAGPPPPLRRRVVVLAAAAIGALVLVGGPWWLAAMLLAGGVVGGAPGPSRPPHRMRCR
jgi:hypothetical protein